MTGEQDQRQQDLAEEAMDAARADDESAAAGEEERIREAVEAALAEQRDLVLRAQAEVQNMRRRCEQDVEKAHRFALERFSGELVTVVDNLERALAAVPETDSEQVKALQEGVELTLKGFLEVLGRFNVVQIDPRGEPFDPAFHEAVATVPDPDSEPNTVLEVFQKGYSLNGRVIRPAMVVVAKGS